LQRKLNNSEAEVKRLTDELEKSDQTVREREDSLQVRPFITFHSFLSSAVK
jgi:peptidoglycan hydrolase CwlO-like protein